MTLFLHGGEQGIFIASASSQAPLNRARALQSFVHASSHPLRCSSFPQKVFLDFSGTPISCSLRLGKHSTGVFGLHFVQTALAFESLCGFIEKRKQSHRIVTLFLHGGEQGIRTLGTFMAFTRFPIVLLRPARTTLQTDQSFINLMRMYYKQSQ